MNEMDFVITEEPYIFGGTQSVLKKYNGTDAAVSVPAHVKKIDRLAFADNLYVENVVLPAGLEEIGSCAFTDCKNLRKVNIPEGIRYVGGSAFSNCEKLEGITLPDRENVIVERTAFFGCPLLEEYWKKRGLCPLCGYKLKKSLFHKTCNRCHTRMK